MDRSDRIVSKFFKSIEKSSDFLNSIRNSHQIVENYKFYYEKQINQRIIECNEFYEKIQNNDNINNDEKFNNKSLQLNRLSNKITKNFNQYVNLCK